MNKVYLITSGQVHAARLSLELVVEFIGRCTPDDVTDPDYAYARARALEILSNLDEGWRHLPTISRIGQG